MGSKTFDGVRFAAWSDDHPPPHVHGYYAGAVVVIELSNGIVGLAKRVNAISPRDAKQSDVNHIVQTARKHANELVELWRSARG